MKDENATQIPEFEAEGVPEELQTDGVFVLDGKGNPIRLEVPDDDD